MGREEEGKGRNPFIDPRGYRSYVAQSEKAFRDELKRQSRAALQNDASGGGEANCT